MKNAFVAFLLLGISLLMTSYSKGTTLEERLWKELQHCLLFSYDDFGPSVLTYTSIGKPRFTSTDTGVENKDAAGKIRIVVTVSGYSLSAQRLMHELAGRHENGFEYRYISYFRALTVLNGVLGDPKLPEACRKRVADTKTKITKEMGDEDQVRKVGALLMNEIDAAVKTLDRAALDKAREFQVKSGPGV